MSPGFLSYESDSFSSLFSGVDAVSEAAFSFSSFFLSILLTSTGLQRQKTSLDIFPQIGYDERNKKYITTRFESRLNYISKEEFTFFEEKAKEKHIEEIIPILKIDSQLSLDEIDKQTVDSLKAIEPFGEENKNPLFLFKNLKIDSIRALTEGKHLKLTVKENKNIVNAIGFNLGTLANEYKIGDKVDIVGNLEMNSFNGVDSIQINIKDIMKSL